MKFTKTSILAIACLTLATLTSRGTLIFNFSSVPGAAIQFNGASHSFQFNSSNGGNQWQINLVSGVPDPAGDALGLYGAVNNGPFGYGQITTSGSTEYAMVNSVPTGGLAINDGSGNYLTATVNWIQVSTTGGSGAINANLQVNVTGFQYSGLNADLNSMVAQGGLGGTMILGFAFVAPTDLIGLSSGTGPYKTTYAGALAVPEPTTMLAGAMLLLPFGFSTLRILRRSVNVF